MIELVRAPNPGPFTLEGTNSWILGGSCVIDPGPAISSHVEAVIAAAPHLDTILITHRHGDHAPAAVELKRRTGAAVLAPPGVLSDDVVDARLKDGDLRGFGGILIETIATPGHTGEHVCFLTSDGDLFTGDMVLGAGTTAIFPPDGHMADYLASLRRLRARGPRRILPGHGPIRDDAAALLTEYIEHRLERERQILSELAAGTRTIPRLRAAIYPLLDPSLEIAAEAQLQAHLIHLAERRMVVEMMNAEFRIRNVQNDEG